ncbi:MAG: DsbA family protein [Mucilaginibacter sp.]|nr:DsbA family protein [Mucilaginibacter sp.]
MDYALTPPVSGKDHFRGDPDAKIELVEYGDFQCPFCGEAYLVIRQLKFELDDRMKFVYRNFPLREIHPQALLAAVAAEAAGNQGLFWEMHDMLFQNQRRLNRASLVQYAELLGLDMLQFESDLSNISTRKIVLSDYDSGLASGVKRTPTFFINGRKFEEDWRNTDSFLQHIDDTRSGND